MQTDDAWEAFGPMGITVELGTTTFEATMPGMNGELVAVVITLVDAGPRDPDRRYVAFARDKRGREATPSNGSPTVRGAIAGIHWSDFDQVEA